MIWDFVLEQIKRFFCFIRKGIAVILILITIFFVILILPVVSKFLVDWSVFDDIEELKSYILLYNNKYSIYFIVIATLAIFFIFSDKDKLIEALSKFKISLKHGDTHVDINKIDEAEETREKKILAENFMKKEKKIAKSEENKNSLDSINEIKNALDIKINKIETNESENSNENNKIIKNLNDDNKSLRFYAACNIINKKTKEELVEIYKNNVILQEDFKDIIISNFKKNNKNNKNLTKNNLEKYANDKYETIFKGLVYLKIIDLSEDNKEVRLTDIGKDFVKEYIIKEGWFR